MDGATRPNFFSLLNNILLFFGEVYNYADRGGVLSRHVRQLYELSMSKTK